MKRELGEVSANITEALRNFPSEQEWQEGVTQCTEQIMELLENQFVSMLGISPQDRARIMAGLESITHSLSSLSCRNAMKKLLESFAQLETFMEKTIEFALLLEEVGNVTFSLDGMSFE